MTENTKAFIKNTILGLLGGGTVSALYALNNTEGKSPSDQDSRANEITVPLSRRQFMKAVRPRGEAKETKSKKEAPAVTKDLTAMTPQELATLKKTLLRSKTASCCSKSKPAKVTGPVAAEKQVKHVAGAGSTFARDAKGRFSVDGKPEKKAGVVDSVINAIGKGTGYIFGDTMDDAKSTLVNSLGLVGGVTTGLAATKIIADRILVNKKKRQVEQARKRYIDALASEVNDEDAPYYRKTAEDKSLLGSTLGLLGLAGITAGSAAGVVMYRIMENRRIAAEKAKDKDLSKYPIDKTIRFRFPADNAPKKDFFA